MTKRYSQKRQKLFSRNFDKRKKKQTNAIIFAFDCDPESQRKARVKNNLVFAIVTSFKILILKPGKENFEQNAPFIQIHKTIKISALIANTKKIKFFETESAFLN